MMHVNVAIFVIDVAIVYIDVLYSSVSKSIFVVCTYSLRVCYALCVMHTSLLVWPGIMVFMTNLHFILKLHSV